MEKPQGRIRESFGKVLKSRKTFIGLNILDTATAYTLYSQLYNVGDFELNPIETALVHHFGTLGGILILKGLLVPGVLGLHAGIKRLDSYVAKRRRAKGKEYDEGDIPDFFMKFLNVGMVLGPVSNSLSLLWLQSLPVVN